MVSPLITWSHSFLFGGETPCVCISILNSSFIDLYTWHVSPSSKFGGGFSSEQCSNPTINNCFYHHFSEETYSELGPRTQGGRGLRKHSSALIAHLLVATLVIIFLTTEKEG